MDSQQRSPALLVKSNEYHYFHKVKSVFPPSAETFIDAMVAEGRYTFATKEATRALSVSPVAARAALRRLAEKGRIAQPVRGFHLIIPPEYRRIGCLPPEQFIPQLMMWLGERYYVAILSAAQYHGAAHQRPQRFQVVVAKNRAPIACGSVEVEFIARKKIARVPTVDVNTPRGPVRIASVEATALDVIGYPSHVGGLDNAATVISELAEKIDPKALVKVAKTAPVSWSQRLGHVLDLLGHEAKTELLATFVRKNAGDVISLVPSARPRRACRVAKWRLDANVEVESEA